MPDAVRTGTAVPTPPAAVVFTDPVLRRFLFAVVIAMTAVVAGVAAAAFYTSFEAIRAFAQRSGGIDPRHAWLAPLLVDSFIFVASAADLWCSATGATRTADGLGSGRSPGCPRRCSAWPRAARSRSTSPTHPPTSAPTSAPASSLGWRRRRWC
jgi:hypothetical protein